MAFSLRNHIFSLIAHLKPANGRVGSKINTLKKIPLSLNSYLKSEHKDGKFVFKLPDKCVRNFIGNDISDSMPTTESSEIISCISRKKYLEETYFEFTVDKDFYISDVLNSPPMLSPQLSNSMNDTVIVEFSSPNIAKPFHMGHLRSTVVGQFVANILSDTNQVIRINYLGDWGTQFGLIQAGLKSMDLDTEISEENPLRIINQAYVKASQDPKLQDEARIISARMESGNATDELEIWKKLREMTIKHLEEMYRLLNIEFDKYYWESQYSKGFSSVLKQMKDLGLVKQIDNQMVVICGTKQMPLLKSDGTSLYLSRDILAALDRIDKYKCTSIKYVVDKSQENHLEILRRIVSSLIGSDPVEHVKFGKIIGMSTRQGTGVFLSDIIDKATHLMAQQQENSPNTRSKSIDVTQTLALTTLVVYLLKQRRTKDFTFDWDLALQSKGDTGVKIQYTHSRLCSLELKCGVQVPSQCIPSLISEPEALNLVCLLDSYEQVKALSQVTLESSYLVNYIFKLCNSTSLCLKKLPVKGQSEELSQQRLLLFHRARLTLNSAMKILGLKPLTTM